MLDSLMVDLSVNGWISLDVTGAVRFEPHIYIFLLSFMFLLRFENV